MKEHSFDAELCFNEEVLPGLRRIIAEKELLEISNAMQNYQFTEVGSLLDRVIEVDR